MRLASPSRPDTVILGKPKLFPCSPLGDRFDLHPVLSTFSLILNSYAWYCPNTLILNESQKKIELTEVDRDLAIVMI
jgi:hypothetical protein